MLEKIDSLRAAIEALTAANKEEVEALRIKYLSKKGEISLLFNDFRNVPNEQKKEIGQKLNELKNLATEKINNLREAVEDKQDDGNEIDLTRSASPLRLGRRHPISLVREEIISIFSRLGFTIAEGPEVEDDWHVFSSLNFAADHPARAAAYTYIIRAITCHDFDRTADTHHLSGQSLQKRSHLGTRALLLPSGGSPLYRQERVVRRPETDAALLCTRDVRTRHGDTPPSVVLPIHRAVGRNGHILPYLRRKGMRFLQAHRMGGNTRMRYGRPQRARRMRNRQQKILRLCARHGNRTHHQLEIQSEGLAHVLRKRCAVP